MNTVMVPSGGGDRTTFVGVIVPALVRGLPKALKGLDMTLFRQILTVVVASLEGNTEATETVNGFAGFECSHDRALSLYAALRELIKLATRVPADSLKKEFDADLEYLKIPKEFAVLIKKAVFGSSRPVIDEFAVESMVRLPTMTKFRWRVDVAISTSALKRALKPSVLMEMTLSSGKICVFEVPVDQFHKLRYNVAYLLKEMEDLEARPVLQS